MSASLNQAIIPYTPPTSTWSFVEQQAMKHILKTLDDTSAFSLEAAVKISLASKNTARIIPVFAREYLTESLKKYPCDGTVPTSTINMMISGVKRPRIEEVQ